MSNGPCEMDMPVLIASLNSNRRSYMPELQKDGVGKRKRSCTFLLPKSSHSETGLRKGLPILKPALREPLFTWKRRARRAKSFSACSKSIESVGSPESLHVFRVFPPLSHPFPPGVDSLFFCCFVSTSMRKGGKMRKFVRRDYYSVLIRPLSAAVS